MMEQSGILRAGKKQIISGLVIASLAATSLVAFGPKGEGKSNNKPMMMKVLKQLDLTDAQKATLKEMRQSKKEERKAMREERKTQGANLGNYFSETGFNRAEFISSATIKFQTRINKKADNIEKIYSILDETQKQEFVKLIQE